MTRYSDDKTAILQSIAETELRLKEIDKEREKLTSYLKELHFKLSSPEVWCGNPIVFCEKEELK